MSCTVGIRKYVSEKHTFLFPSDTLYTGSEGLNPNDHVSDCV